MELETLKIWNLWSEKYVNVTGTAQIVPSRLPPGNLNKVKVDLVELTQIIKRRQKSDGIKYLQRLNRSCKMKDGKPNSHQSG